MSADFISVSLVDGVQEDELETALWNFSAVSWEAPSRCLLKLCHFY